MPEREFEIVNVVGTSEIGHEVDLDALSESLDQLTWQKEEADKPGLYVQLINQPDRPDSIAGIPVDELVDMTPEDFEDRETDFEDVTEEIDLPKIMVFRSGKYNIPGCDDLEDLHQENKRFLDELESLDDFPNEFISADPEDVVIENVVGNGQVDDDLNLVALSMGLGLAQVEYEPERFPALIYRSEDYSCTFLIFAGGSVVAPGGNDPEKIRSDFYDLMDEIDEWLSL